MLRPARLSYQINEHVMGELKDLVQIMIQEVGLDVTVKRILWVKAIRITNYCFRSWAVYGWTTKSAP
jgi:hypothetical protein